MTYSTYKIRAWFEDGTMVESEITAVDSAAAVADMAQAFSAKITNYQIIM